MKISRPAMLATLATLILPQAVFAHAGAPGHTHGLAEGFMHPLAGLDHMLAMIAVGLWAAQRGGRMTWALPAAFVGFMAIGGAMGIAGMPMPMVESGVAASVLVLGLAVATGFKLNGGASAALVALFALLHGHAHGTELAAGGEAIGYSFGFIAATIALHAAGIGIALGLRGERLGRVLQVGGGAIAAAGAMMIVGLI